MDGWIQNKIMMMACLRCHDDGQYILPAEVSLSLPLLLWVEIRFATRKQLANGRARAFLFVIQALFEEDFMKAVLWHSAC